MKDAIARINKNRRKAQILNVKKVVYDTVFVVNANSKGWILDKICKIIMNASNKNCYILYTERNDQLTFPPPLAHEYFFSHYSVAFWSAVKYPEISSSRIGVWFTHFDNGKGISVNDLALFFNACHRVFTPNSRDKDALEAVGVKPDLLRVILGGADSDFFRSHIRGHGVVGIVGAYYERKQPSKLYDVVSSMPNTKFMLLAPGPDDVANPGILWRNWPRFDDLRKLSNFTYKESAYDKFPDFYDMMDVYISLSELEGGPIPIIEAMMSNVIPIATDTGFARDIMTGDTQKYIINIDEPTGNITSLIRQAIEDTTLNVRDLAEHLSWAQFGEQISSEMDLQYSYGDIIDFSEGENGFFYLTEGWCVPEQRGVKTSDSIAKIQVPITKCSTGLISISLDVWNVMIESSEQSEIADKCEITITVNDSIIARNFLLSSIPTNIKRIIDIDKLPVKNPLNIVFTVATSASLYSVEPHRAQAKLGKITVEEVDIPKDVSTLNFTQCGTANNLLCGDWHSSEKNGVWSKSIFASIFIPTSIFKNTTENSYLYVVGREFIDSEKSQKMKILVNGVESSYSKEPMDERNSFNQYLIDITKPQLSGLSIIEVTFSFEKIASPNEIDANSKDVRRLGFFLREVSTSQTV